MALIPDFTFKEETELVSSLYSAVAFYKQYAETSPDNSEYWKERAETAQKVADKFYAACQNAIYNL